MGKHDIYQSFAFSVKVQANQLKYSVYCARRSL